MKVSELPEYLIKPMPRSRVKGHVQTLAQFHLRTNSGFHAEVAICENVVAFRTSDLAGLWTKWNDEKFANHDAALVSLKEKVKGFVNRGFYSNVSTGLLLPLNETDVRHLRADGLLPRAILEYGSELYDALDKFHQDQAKKYQERVETTRGSAAAPPAPAVKPAAAPVAPAAVGESMDDVLAKLKARTAAVKF